MACGTSHMQPQLMGALSAVLVIRFPRWILKANFIYGCLLIKGRWVLTRGLWKLLWATSLDGKLIRAPNIVLVIQNPPRLLETSEEIFEGRLIRALNFCWSCGYVLKVSPFHLDYHELEHWLYGFWKHRPSTVADLSPTATEVSRRNTGHHSP